MAVAELSKNGADLVGGKSAGWRAIAVLLAMCLGPWDVTCSLAVLATWRSVRQCMAQANRLLD